MNALEILQTPRLVLRRLQRGDLTALAALYADPDMRRHYPDGTLSTAQTAAEIEYFLDGHPQHPELGLWATVEQATGRFLGRCGLLPWQIDGRHEVELACMIDKARWGEGLASEAARGIIAHARDRLGLRRMICVITPGNTASVRLATKVGMRLERDYTDEHGDCHIYGRELRGDAQPWRPPLHHRDDHA